MVAVPLLEIWVKPERCGGWGRGLPCTTGFSLQCAVSSVYTFCQIEDASFLSNVKDIGFETPAPTKFIQVVEVCSRNKFIHVLEPFDDYIFRNLSNKIVAHISQRRFATSFQGLRKCFAL